MRMCRLRDSDLYCVAMKMRRKPELMQLLSVKSMIRYGPAEVDGGLGALFGQGVETLAGSAGEEDDEYVVQLHVGPVPRE